jgi:hypothetical protein
MGADVVAAQLSVVAIPAATTADRLLRSRPASHRLVRYCHYGHTCGNRQSLLLSLVQLDALQASLRLSGAGLHRGPSRSVNDRFLSSTSDIGSPPSSSTASAWSTAVEDGSTPTTGIPARTAGANALIARLRIERRAGVLIQASPQHRGRPGIDTATPAW